jgi:ribosomal protein L28
VLKLKISSKALRVIDAIADFVESKNTRGSGARYALRFKLTL